MSTGAIVQPGRLRAQDEVEVNRIRENMHKARLRWRWSREEMREMKMKSKEMWIVSSTLQDDRTRPDSNISTPPPPLAMSHHSYLFHPPILFLAEIGSLPAPRQ
jgi:hypothetical protein